jgi:hypothetical protein
LAEAEMPAFLTKPKKNPCDKAGYSPPAKNMVANRRVGTLVPIPQINFIPSEKSRIPLHYLQ